MSIDWSKAPEGCIGAFARIISKTAFFVFSKRPSDYMSREGYEGEGEDGPYHVFSEYWEWIDKPWDGQGLPPVGAKCLTDRNDFIREVTILCHGKTRTFVFDHVSQEEICLLLKDRVFLAHPHPEQIAADEREKAVGDMAMSIQGVPYQYPTLYALYDAGWRLTNKK
ncbi:hypothetical protein [Pseudomonas aeruginosa]|uniref:hypothetical protein n=1 Tax=Pseudomonas aeruginosa TaxID=287 RepID=UPI000F8985C5|nr:hypothetical protein [Pseudomonas aeruginosa]EKV0256514.1 hypothetical protein [Pseudomonas aeruginosa]RTU36055.1 hypothetical protein DY972_12740 [Pseudomonas aeruginosa]HBO3445877.1 hypothetical protein [Pseudomonas aeruginosa]HBO3464838.1 hypothetical protein [Pseudomonas aeruginosa]HEP9680937.1 hypothetical protein [Pseudomonas aeruginosa]